MNLIELIDKLPTVDMELIDDRSLVIGRKACRDNRLDIDDALRKLTLLEASNDTFTMVSPYGTGGGGSCSSLAAQATGTSTSLADAVRREKECDNQDVRWVLGEKKETMPCSLLFIDVGELP